MKKGITKKPEDCENGITEITIEDIKSNLAKANLSDFSENLYDFLRLYEDSKGKKGFVTISKKSLIRKKNSIPNRRLKRSSDIIKSANKITDFLSPQSRLTLKLSCKKDPTLSSFKFNPSPMSFYKDKHTFQIPNTENFQTNHSQVPSPRRQTKNQRKLVKKGKSIKISANINHTSPKAREISPYTEPLFLSRRLPSLEKPKCKEKLTSPKKFLYSPN